MKVVSAGMEWYAMGAHQCMARVRCGYIATSGAFSCAGASNDSGRLLHYGADLLFWQTQGWIPVDTRGHSLDTHGPPFFAKPPNMRAGDSVAGGRTPLTV